MPDDETTAGGTTTPDPPPPPPDTPPEGDDKGQAALERARREAGDLRRKLREAEDERDGLKAASQTEQEKAVGRAEQAEKRADAALERVRATSLKAEVGIAAPGLGIVNAKAALRLLDDESIEYDGEGEAIDSTVTKALKAAVKEYPFLTRAGSADAGEGANGERGGGSGGVGSDQFSRDLNAALRRTRQ